MQFFQGIALIMDLNIVPPADIPQDALQVFIAKDEITIFPGRGHFGVGLLDR